jgi:hypothetical protein
MVRLPIGNVVLDLSVCHVSNKEICILVLKN